MKDNIRKILFGIICFWTLESFCQEALISIHEQNELVAGVHNYLDILAPCTPNDSLFISMSNGTIIKKDYAYIAIPERCGNSWISVFKINGNDTTFISKQEFRVVHLSKYFYATIALRSWGKISKEDLLSERGIEASVNGLGFDFRLPVCYYKLLVLRDNNLLFYKEQNSNEFSPDIIKFFKTLESGDCLYFLDIKVSFEDSYDMKYNANPIQFEIK